jgi:hypothetical protein
MLVVAGRDERMRCGVPIRRYESTVRARVALPTPTSCERQAGMYGFGLERRALQFRSYSQFRRRQVAIDTEACAPRRTSTEGQHPAVPATGVLRSRVNSLSHCLVHPIEADCADAQARCERSITSFEEFPSSSSCWVVEHGDQRRGVRGCDCRCTYAHSLGALSDCCGLQTCFTQIGACSPAQCQPRGADVGRTLRAIGRTR